MSGQASQLRAGLVSVTFRALSAAEIVELAVAERLAAIEWGGDRHVPHGDLVAARSVRKMCEDRGLGISAYGSYFRCGAEDDPAASAVLETAAELGAGMVRVWAGRIASAAAGQRERDAVAESLRDFCDLAAQRELIVAIEFHGGTLADDADSCLGLIAEVDRANLKTFWQPLNGMEPAAALGTLRRVRPHLSNLHVFHWWPDHLHRHALADGGNCWPAYLGEAASDGRSRFASLEFVRGDSVEQFRRDAAMLRMWLGR